MKLLAVLFICLAAYLQFPLSRQISIDPEASKQKIEIESESPESPLNAASRSEILRALEIIQLGVSSGLTISDALEYSQVHAPDAAAYEIDRALNRFRIGLPLAQGLEQMAVNNPGWRSISDTLITSLNSGSSVLGQLADVAFVMQSTIDTKKLKRIKSVAVKSVLPLGLCFLPAFILLAVIPVVAGLLQGLI